MERLWEHCFGKADRAEMGFAEQEGDDAGLLRHYETDATVTLRRGEFPRAQSSRAGRAETSPSIGEILQRTADCRQDFRWLTLDAKSRSPICFPCSGPVQDIGGV